MTYKLITSVPLNRGPLIIPIGVLLDVVHRVSVEDRGDGGVDIPKRGDGTVD